MRFKKKLKEIIVVGFYMISLFCPAQEHMIEVKRYSDYAKDYLTIVDAGMCYYTKNEATITLSYKLDIDRMSRAVFKDTTLHKLFYYPQPGWVVTEINGISTKQMSEEIFYSILDNQDSVLLNILRTPQHAIQYVFYPQQSWPKLLSDYGVTIEKINNLKKQHAPWGNSQIQEREKNNKKYSISTLELVDSEFDWFFAQTYDYIIVGEDPLTDKGILDRFTKELPTMERDSENPDIYLMVAKNADESIQTTYVPPTNMVVNLGSTTTSRYSFLTNSNEYVTRQRNYTIREGGFTQTTKDMNIYFELTMLDAKKIKDSLQITPPIVWQNKTTRYVVNPDFNIHDEYLAYASWAPIKCNYTWNKQVTTSLWGATPIITCENSKIISVDKDVNSILKPGDIIVKYNYGKKQSWHKANGFNTRFFEENSNKKFYRCVIIRDGKRKTLDGVTFKKAKEFKLFWWE